MIFLFVLLAMGLIAGRIASVWAAACIEPSLNVGLRRCDACGQSLSIVEQLFVWYPGIKCSGCFAKDRIWPLWASLFTAATFVGFGWLLVRTGCQTVSEVRPSLDLWQNRLPFHLLFIFLLVTATLTDLLDYVILDMIVLPGALIAIVWASLSGESQMIHVWVDWNYDQAIIDGQIHFGPYLPEWMKNHQHLHGLVWSISGLLTGAGLMWAARIAACLILGVPAIGFGDVTLMAMIGAFMGWQPTLCALGIAPLVGIVLGFGGRIVTGRGYVAFGPYLCIAALIILCTWRMFWEVLRLKIIFSHWPTVAAMVAGSFIAYCVLLVGLRIFRATSAERLR